MKRLIIALALIAGPACAQPLVRVTNVKYTGLTPEQKQRRLALEEMLGRAQLEVLIDQVVTEGERIERGRRGDQVLASNGRK